MRCVEESLTHEKNCFVTLTYNDENKPKNDSLTKRDLQLFMKRLRKKYGVKIRFFACGEYGEQNQRPHYHLCLFNHDFPDKTLWACRDNINLYRSEELAALWPYGFSTIGDVTFESAAYVARYVLKKINGDAAAEHYKGRIPEFVNMSRRPGIARAFFEENSRDIYAIDSVIMRNMLKLRPPKYYDKLYEIQQPEHMKEIKQARQSKHKAEEMQAYRLRTKHRSQLLKIKQLKRGYENV